MLTSRYVRQSKKCRSYQNKVIDKFSLLLLFLFIISSLTIFPQSDEDCLMCHDDPEFNMERNGKTVSLYANPEILANSTHQNLSCVSCHIGFDPNNIPHKENIKPIDCKLCHENAPIKHSFHPQMLNTPGTATQPDVSCKNCHGTHDVKHPNTKDSKWRRDNFTEACGSCHNDIEEKYVHSKHSEAFQKNVKGAPTCLNCHDNSIVTKDAKTEQDSLNIKIAQEKLCLSCHLDDPEIRARTSPSTGFITAYEESVHGFALMNGNKNAANCVNCHTSHSVKDGLLSESTVNKLNIPNTCGQCHTEIEKTYKKSIHGISALEYQNEEAPVCTDCHGEHNILRHDDPASPVSFRNLSEKVCTPCHSSVRLTNKFGIESDKYKTFNDSYHGLALKGGSLTVANCASCHGYHDILPASDPNSKVNKANLVETCGTCHPGANKNFTIGKIHVSLETKEDEPLLYWIATIYIILIVLTIGAMFLHNIVDFFRKAKIKKMKQRGLIKEEHHGHSLYLRMTRSERIQHATMALSFIVLVITGFMLRYPDSWWVGHIKDLSQDAFEYRSLLHRIAAVFMVSVSLYHIYYISFTKRGKQLVKDLLPNLQDLKDAIGVAKFNLGISKIKPRLDRFSYIEKAEYWALVWGTIVMSVTGFILWFDNTFIGLLTKLGWDVARTIHYYEAWLAFLAIVVWHFYFVIFNPDIYPMNLSWLKGTITEEEMADEHPAELDRIKKQKAENNNVDEPDKPIGE